MHGSGGSGLGSGWGGSGLGSGCEYNRFRSPVTDCYDNIHHKRFSTLLFLYIKKTFDSVCHKKLLKKLNFYGIQGVANTLISSYLRNRKQFFCINNEFSTFKSIDLGVP